MKKIYILFLIFCLTLLPACTIDPSMSSSSSDSSASSEPLPEYSTEELFFQQFASFQTYEYYTLHIKDDMLDFTVADARKTENGWSVQDQSGNFSVVANETESRISFSYRDKNHEYDLFGMTVSGILSALCFTDASFAWDGSAYSIRCDHTERLQNMRSVLLLYENRPLHELLSDYIGADSLELLSLLEVGVDGETRLYELGDLFSGLANLYSIPEVFFYAYAYKLTGIPMNTLKNQIRTYPQQTVEEALTAHSVEKDVPALFAEMYETLQKDCKTAFGEKTYSFLYQTEIRRFLVESTFCPETSVFDIRFSYAVESADYAVDRSTEVAVQPSFLQST